jgi:hypothetical protein
MDAIKKKMSSYAFRSSDETAKKLGKITLELSKLVKDPPSSEKYPLGGRDEKSGRSYSN